MHIVLLFKPESYRSRFVANSAYQGLKYYKGSDLKVTLAERNDYPRLNPDVLIAYGWIPFKSQFEKQIKRGKKYVFADLGFWGRKTGTLSGGRDNIDSLGFHKLSINHRHPVDHLFRQKPSTRFDKFNIDIKDWKRGDNIVVVGMSAKAARSYGYSPQQWEKQTISRLQKITDRKIIYRSKPGDIEGRPIPGVDYCSPNVPFIDCLKNAHAVVSRHSNASVEALAQGIQVYSEDNVGRYLSMKSLDCINEYHWPEGRDQFFYDIAYTQWSPRELMSGEWFEDYRELLYV